MTSSLSSRRAAPVIEATEQSWLSFQLAGQLYAAPLAQVGEVLRDSELTPVPGAAHDLLGIRHLRGQIVPVMDGRRRLGLDDRAGADPAQVRVVILSLAGQQVGLRVDAIGDLIHPAPADIAPAPPGRAARPDEPVLGVVSVAQGFAALLDVPRLCRLPGAD
ncbi:chemotaxis protein CheW [Dyella sp.]|jgi:purine-binding chemotaxis protein CheW|uniref:chemotaxis protein CheW n=1 Tax=Dyella sp. TaxID=1869338 RepID=UPI002D790602|nr:chemotaxis protein CheW [Dyella sp.]HET6431115.1 chemotaxis protein CheW [Dyella sp.]